MSDIYLDYAAATPLDSRVHEAMEPFFMTEFANPSSNHAAGKRAKAALEQARAEVAGVLEVDPEEIIFTSSGTASLNAAVLGAARKSERSIIWASPVEHNAVLEPAKALERDGKKLQLFEADQEGRVKPKPLGEGVALVSVMLANNEVGTIQEIAAFAKGAHAAGALMHTDASQAAQTVRVRPRELAADLVSLDGQKIFGPKGVGVLYVKKGIKLAPYYWGSAQEHGLAPGTENVAAIVGFAAALTLANQSLDGESKRLNALRDDFEKGITAAVSDAVVIGAGAPRAAHISTVALPGTERDVVQAYLSKRGVFVSTGAACDPRGSGGISHVLEAMGIAPEVAEGALRISFGRPTTAGEVAQAVKEIAEVVKLLS